MTDKELNQHFSREQRLWLDKNGASTEGKTEEQILADWASQLYEAGLLGNSEKDMEHLLNLTVKPKSVYSVKDILSTVAPGQKTDSAAVSQFIEDWNEGNVDSKAPGRLYFKYGEHGVENADKVMKQAYADKQAVKDNEVGTVNKLLGTVFYPRSLEAMKAGKSVGGKDIVLDAVEDVLMAMPIGLLAAAPKVVRAGKVAQLLAGLGTSVAVPHIMEGADAALYSPEENLDRSKYRESDALIGSVTNAAAPFILGRGLNKLKRFGSVEGGTAGLSSTTKATMDNLISHGQWQKPTQETIDAVAQFNHANKASAGAAGKVGEETVQQIKKAKEAEGKALDALSKSSQVLASNTSFEKAAEAVMSSVQKVNAAKKEIAKVTPLEQIVVATERMNTKTNPSQDFLEAGLVQKRMKESGKSAKDVLNEAADIQKFAKQLEGATWTDKLRYKSPVGYGMLEAAQSFGTNRYGSNRDADVILTGVSNMAQGISPGLNLSKSLKESRAEDIKAEQKKLNQSYAKAVLESLPKDASEDRKYMQMVVDNPDVLKGMGKGNTPAFRNWYLLRGSDILRGTELYRPTFEVE